MRACAKEVQISNLELISELQVAYRLSYSEKFHPRAIGAAKGSYSRLSNKRDKANALDLLIFVIWVLLFAVKRTRLCTAHRYLFFSTISRRSTEESRISYLMPQQPPEG